jgi:predicted ATP-grasp superfamily ATP-dependent carboligase
LLLGGAENAVACARRFAGAGIETVVVNRAGTPALRSRRIVPAATGQTFDEDTLREWLDGATGRWGGAVVIPLSDPALRVMAHSYDHLSESFRPALMNPVVVEAMLDKQRTVELARAGGIRVPRQWEIPENTSIEELDGELEYPLILKPRRTSELVQSCGRKYLRADSESQLRRHLPTMSRLPHGFVLNEFLPGGDELLSSYNAVRSRNGDVLIEFTKRVDRRDPPNEGGATFHELTHRPETMRLGRQFSEHVGLIGVGNVEFKADPVTHELTLVECNHRLTAALALMQDNGIDLAGIVYEQACGRDVRRGTIVEATGSMWYPIRDLRSFRRSGAGVRPWLARPRGSSYPYFRWTDPGPSLALARRTVRAFIAARRRGARSR